MLLINLAGLILIALIVWWFWLYKPKATQLSEDDLLIIVENGVYQPSQIQLSSGKPHDLIFLRKDASGCSETLLIPELEISETLPLNKRTTVHVPSLAPGEYAFHCQMQMYKGLVTVV